MVIYMKHTFELILKENPSRVEKLRGVVKTTDTGVGYLIIKED